MTLTSTRNCKPHTLLLRKACYVGEDRGRALGLEAEGERGGQRPGKLQGDQHSRSQQGAISPVKLRSHLRPQDSQSFPSGAHSGDPAADWRMGCAQGLQAASWDGEGGREEPATPHGRGGRRKEPESLAPRGHWVGPDVFGLHRFMDTGNVPLSH